MPTQDDFPKSAVLHFPPSVYQKFGAAEMIPNLLEILHVEDLRCVQFLRNGKVRVSFREKDVRDHYLVEGLRLGDHDIPVTKDGQKVTVLYIRDLPYEVPSDDLIDFFSNYGEVLTNGNRILKLILNEDLPYFLSVCGYQCRVWYRGQPLQCLVCRERAHRAQSCPLSGRCRYCHQVGHMARDCAQAWDPPPSVPVDADVDVDVASVSDSATVIEDDCDPEPVDKPSDPEPPVKRVPVAVPVEFVPDKPPVDVSMTNTAKTRVPDKLPTADPVPEVSNKPSADVPMTNTTKTGVSDDLPAADPVPVKVSDKPPV